LVREENTRERCNYEISALPKPLPTGNGETRPELLKSKIIVAEQVVSLRLRQLVSTTDDYEEQIALAAALKSLKVLKEQ